MSKESTKPTAVEILRINVKQRMSKDNKPLALLLNVEYNPDKTDVIIDMLSEVCESFGLYCISNKKAEELGLLDDED